jgi:ectoine hydroxylase-related dioxygenase (phytanoyl-CoA dioxygenase family)
MLDPKLLELGFTANALTPQQKAALDKRGFTILENLIDPDWLAQLRQAFENVTAAEGIDAGKEVNQVGGVRRLSDLVNKGDVFDGVYLQPTLLTAVAHVLKQPFKLHSLNGHDPLPGEGQQALHSDGGKTAGPPIQHQVVNSMWMLDDLTPDNGATRVVPGSHLEFRPLPDLVENREADHPDQVLLCAPAGSVAVFNGSAWHSCTRNNSQQKRRVLHCAFILRGLTQQTDQQAYLQPETDWRLSPLARYILDV